MQSVGNDYVFMDCFEQEIENPEKISRNISKRRTSVGSDGLILIMPSTVADCRMRIFNSDGSEGRMCGNGVRCTGAYMYYKKGIKKKNIAVETLSGICEVIIDDTKKTVTTSMPDVQLNARSVGLCTDYILGGKYIDAQKEQIINKYIIVNKRKIIVNCVSVGNPHCVLFFDKIPGNIEKMSSWLKSENIFKNGINIEYVSVTDERSAVARVYERGSGETTGCGSGACAIAVASVLTGRFRKNNWNSIFFPGGELKVMIEENGKIYLQGETFIAFEGSVDI